MPTATLLRREVEALAATAGDDLSVLWRDADNPAALETALRDVLPALIDSYALAAGAAAADWYDDLRNEREVAGRFGAIVHEVPDKGAHALIGWALTTANDMPAFQSLVLGGTQRRIANGSRGTLLRSTDEDPKATGWIRVGVGECDWCKQYLDGEVRTVEGYDFDAHDWCKCDVDPVFD